MRVALEGHQLLDAASTEPHDAADVVAGKVDEHHVLRALLRVLAELGGHAPVVLLAAAATSRPRDRSADDPTLQQLHHRLGRRARDRDLRVAQEVHVRRRVDLAQHAVHVERVDRLVQVEALREHDLEDVAREDVLAGGLDGRLVETTGHRGAERRQLGELVGRGWRRRVRQRAGQLVDATVEAVDGALIGVGGVDGLVQEDVLDEIEALAEVVERGHVTGQRQNRVGNALVVGRDVGQVLDLADDVVAEVADDAAVERWELGIRGAR